MRKIVVGAQVSMDGIMQAPGGPWEDPTRGFTFGGWVMPVTQAWFRTDRLNTGRTASGIAGSNCQ
jgi:hypothetical protein